MIGTGERLKGRYRLERTLGRGGMAAVWLGHDEVLDRPVAVKVLSDTIAGDPGFVARFRREATTAARLSHPNLVGVYDFSEEDERPYLVMQFVPGENLAERLERVDCDQLARELLDALAHIHEVGILHRDIKPANVIVEPDGTAKLIDFGIALPQDATALTSTGLILGTERFAAPEVMEGRSATERSDLYSCGLVLRSCQGRCSRALRFLVGEMTSRDPHDRPLSARHALARLERPAVAVDEPTRAMAPPPSEGPDPPRSGSSVSRRTAVAAIAGLVAALVVVLVALGGGGDSGGGERTTQAEKGASQREEAAAPSPAPEETKGESTPEPEPAPSEAADPALGASLNEEGFALIQAGEYEAAVPVLEEAVAAFPEGTEDLDYAYALFNLGNALRLSGHPEAAIPILERRLEIPNQEGEVRKELEAAETESG